MEFKPKLNVKISQSLEKRFAQDVDNLKVNYKKPKEEISLSGLRSLYKQIAEFGGVEMLKGKQETRLNNNRQLEEGELKFKKSGYTELLRNTPESKQIAKIREKIIKQFDNPGSIN